MTYFILYEDEKRYRDLYRVVVLKLMGSKNERYKIINMDKYSKEMLEKIMALDGRKIFILDIEVPGKSGLDFAREIRKEYDDWESQMIVVSNHQQMKSVSFMSRLLMLDFVSKYYNCEEHLRDALVDAINILDGNKYFTYTIDGELYKVPYSSILYIEKDKDESSSLLVTKSKSETIKVSFPKIWKKLETDSRFFKSTRSCIVNINNITGVDLNNRVIKFGNIEINSLSRDKKKELKERIEEKK